ncbi:hypothetical protein ACCO45_006084 [Purpureocillium lilacinum]|uniref:Uncharacterized protein n=1 Tax=Purpureocillium lilacinum TaxID=33203 RepID=A0ACC4DX85_PURLI
MAPAAAAAAAASAASASPPSSLSLAAPAPAPSAPSDAEAREKPDRAQERPVAASSKRDYKGFVAGVFSGIAKLTVGHPFDTVKVRLQTTDAGRFSGPLQCVAQTVRNEGVRGLYKGATPPLVGWMFMDSVMLGSLAVYRRLMAQHVFGAASWAPGAGDGSGFGFKALLGIWPPYASSSSSSSAADASKASSRSSYLPPLGHGLAGILAGSTVKLHRRARRARQGAAADPIRGTQVRAAVLWPARLRGQDLPAPRRAGTIPRALGDAALPRLLLLLVEQLRRAVARAAPPHVAVGARHQLLGRGLSAQVFWLTSYPSDLVKQRIMTDPLGGGLGDGARRFPAGGTPPSPCGGRAGGGRTGEGSCRAS